MEVTDVGRRRERENNGGKGGGGEKRDLDGPISRFTILMCIGRLYKNVFFRTALVFFFSFFFFSSLTNEDVEHILVRKRE